MLVSDLITECNSLVDDTFQTADWLAWFKDAVIDIRPVLHITATQVIATVPGQSDYTVPANFREALYIIVNSITYGKIGQDDFTSTGFRILDTTLTIQPTPTDTILTRLFYVKNAAIPTITGDTFDVPDDAVPLIKLYACHCSQQKDEEPTRVTDFYTEYMSKKASYGDTAKRLADVTPTQVGGWAVIR